MTTPGPRETLLRWNALVAMYGSESLALAVLLRKADQLDHVGRCDCARAPQPAPHLPP